MGYLTPLKTKFEALRESTPGIVKLVFDDLSTINSDSSNVYPLMLLKPPVAESNKDDRDLQYSFLEIDCFIFKPLMSDDVNHWTVLFDECNDLMTTFLRQLFASQPHYVLNGAVKITPGHYQHNANLVGCRAQFKLRVHNGC